MILAELLLSALLLAGPPAADAAARITATAGSRATVLRTLEGRVMEVGEAAGEGALPVVTLKLQTRQGEFQVVTAPAGVLSDIGFSVAVGDRVRARVFFDPALRLAYAQKLLNQSQGLLVRLRTLRHEPLWDAGGTWQGGRAELPPRQAAPERTRRGRGDRPNPERPKPRPPH